MELFLSICLGIGLSAACGFRVFIPMLVMSLAAHSGQLELSPTFVWLGSTPALLVLSVATLMELTAFYIPVVDNLLDGIAIPAATVAGVVVTASCVTDVSPLLQWSLATIAGGGMAAGVQLSTTKLRLASTATTGGLANPILATMEAGSALLMSALAVIVPVLAALMAVVGVVLMGIAAAWVGSKLARLIQRLRGKTPSS
ncbi:MAG: DUF4126 domain-containing protein [Myxococcota bacterium]